MLHFSINCSLTVIYFCYVGMLNSNQDQIECSKKVFICHWNLNSIAAHKFAKPVLLKAYNSISIHKFDIVCLSQTYFDSNILPNDSNLESRGYNFVCSDHPSNKNREVFEYNTRVICLLNEYLPIL